MDREPVFFSSSWTSLNTCVVSFRRDWNKTRPPALFWGKDLLPLRNLEPATLADYANLSGYFTEGDRLHFAVRADRFAHIDFEKERLYVVGEFNQWADAIGDKSWELKPKIQDEVEFFILAVPKGKLDRRGSHRFKFVTGSGHWLEVPADAPNVTVDASGNRNFQIRPHRTGRHRFHFEAPVPLNRSADARLVYRESGYEESIPVKPGVFLKTLETGSPLGVTFEGEFTVFRIFAPRAERVSLYLFDSLENDQPRPVPLQMSDELVWEAKVKGNRSGWYYYYKICGAAQEGYSHFDESFRILDPYAKACVGPLGPGIVVSPERLSHNRPAFAPPKWHDLIIAEAHVRDLIAYSSLDLPGKERLGYVGLKKWIESEGCYIRELGINALELQPIHEFDTVDPKEYGWGYMPVNYFSPASQYCLDPECASQIEEFRGLVDAIHQAGLAVIIDVVYNHVGNPNYLQYVDKEYYFLLNTDGDYINHSGCGNTIDPDTPMSRRLMLESMKHFIEAFDVDGFRFDLGELLGIECLTYLEQEIKKIKPSVFLVAEPWSFRGHIGPIMKQTGVAFWNDGYREFVKDFVCGRGSTDGLRFFLQGGTRDLTAFPAQTVNYVCSHDDRVWIDKITENGEYNGYFPTFNDRRRTHLMISILMMSAGIPMLHSGLDFLYSKHGKNNTYLDGATNALNYDRLRFFSGTHQYFRDWMRFRLSDSGSLLRLDGHPEAGYFRDFAQDGCLGMLYNANAQFGAARLFFAINPTFSDITLSCEAASLANFTQIADHERFDPGGLQSALYPISDGGISMPALSCGLWRL